MTDETERRIQAAADAASRTRQTKEFLDSLTKNDELVKPIYNPEAWVIRNKAKGAAERGEIERTNCHHPLQFLQQYIDDDPSVKRDGKPVNLFECGVCHMLLWFVDPWGVPVADA